MFGYIYKTTNLLNGKIYIGKKKSPVFIEDYFGSGKLIRRAINQYGAENFQVKLVYWAKTLEELNEKEKFYITFYESHYTSGKGYNIALGGDGGDLINQLPYDEYMEFVDECRRRSIGKNNPNYGKGDKIRGENNPSKRLEVREKLSNSLKGEANGMFGKTHSKETMERILKTKREKYGTIPNQFTRDPNHETWNGIKCALYDDDILIKKFRSFSQMYNYCVENELWFSKKMLEQSMEENLYMKDVFLYYGSRSYKKNLDAMERYPNYRVVKLDNTELTR